MSEPNSLPRGWIWTTIGALAVSMKNGIYKPKDRYTDDGIACLRMYNIDRGSLVWKDIKRMRLDSDEVQEYGLKEGDILVNRVNSRELVGKACIIPPGLDPCVYESKNIRLRLNSRTVLPQYANYRFLHCGQAYFAGNAQQTVGMASISQGQLGAFPIPLPPLDDQRRIVQKIEELFSKLDAGVTALERIKAALKRYRAAVLKAAVEGKLTAEWRARHPANETGAQLLRRILDERRRRWEQEQRAKYAKAGKEPPKGWQAKYIEPSPPSTANLPELPGEWCWATVEQLMVFLRNGLSQKPAASPPGHPILRINAVRPMRVNLGEVRYLNPPPDDAEGYRIEDGDLLFTRYNGSLDLLGVAGMVRGCTQPLLHPDKLIRVKMALGQPLSAFVEVASNVGASRKHMAGRARTTAGQTGISGQDVREMPIPLPPLAEQEQIISVIETRLSVVEEVGTQVEADLKRAARLRQSILNRAFEGWLVPQDPHDEPAEKLLERIRQERQSEPAVARSGRRGDNGRRKRRESHEP